MKWKDKGPRKMTMELVSTSLPLSPISVTSQHTHRNRNGRGRTTRFHFVSSITRGSSPPRIHLARCCWDGRWWGGVERGIFRNGRGENLCCFNFKRGAWLLSCHPPCKSPRLFKRRRKEHNLPSEWNRLKAGWIGIPRGSSKSNETRIHSELYKVLLELFSEEKYKLWYTVKT